MKRQFNKPLRTYGRKKPKEVIIPIPKLDNWILWDGNDKNHVSLNATPVKKETEIQDKSMYYDPLDTTFDRLRKNARIPTVFKEENDTASCNNVSNSLLANANDSETDECKSLSHELSNLKVKPISMRKPSHKKLRMHVIKKKIVRKKKTTVQSGEAFRVQKDDSHSEYKAHKTISNKENISDNLNVDFFSTSSNIKVSEEQSCMQQKRKVFNKKNYVKKRRKNNTHFTQFSKNIEIKPCSVVLNRCNILEWESKLNIIESNLSKKADQCTTRISTLPDLEKTAKTGTDLNDRKNIVTNCFVKVQHLKTDSFMKPLSPGNKYEHIISSTPNGKPIRASTNLIGLSPIVVRCMQKTLINETNKIPLVPTQKDDGLHRSATIEKLETMEKSEMTFSYLKNSSNVTKCNLRELEFANEKTINSYGLTYTTSNICNEAKPSAKEESVETSLQNIKRRCTILLPKCTTTNIGKRKQHLSFTVDTNRSQSLFNDSNGSIQSLLNKDNATTCETEILIDNFGLHARNPLPSNEISVDSTTLSEKSIVDTNIGKILTCDETQKNVAKVVVPKLSTTSLFNALSDDIENITKCKEADDERSVTLSAREKTLPSKNHIINTNNSLVENINKSNIKPSYVILNQLEDPVRITKRRKYTKWDLDLNSIAEDSDSTDMGTKQTHLQRTYRGSQKILQRKTEMPLGNVSDEFINHAIEKPVFLKPGKSWARSLSILNNMQNESNLDKLCIGKGKKWRHSVQDLLNMQKQGIIQSCIKRNDSSKELQSYDEAVNGSGHEAVCNKDRTCDYMNLGRISRRISIRVVPIHKTIKSVEDAPFLEVYGIVPVKRQRYTLLNNTRKSRHNVQTNAIDRQIIEETEVSTAKEVILRRCLQKDYVPFSEFFSNSYLEYCQKIGEGVYGEVFLYEQENTKSVIKIIPIEGSEHVNGEPQKKFHEILSEIVIAMELHNLRLNTEYNTDGFVEVKNIKCIKGRYPKRLIELWNMYDEDKHSDNDCPSMFGDDQLFIILELGHGGQDLEAFVFNTADEAHILFVQAALALAVAEKAIQFEHRDLHWGNTLISLTNEPWVHYKLGQKNIKLISKGVKVSIIDFTLSRVTYQGCSVFNDLASDPTLFTAQGEYQFEIYRLMKDKVKNNWQKFEPYTNILWLHYTLDKMITAVRYRKKNLKIHKHGIEKLIQLKNEVLTYISAFEFVTNCDKIVNLLYID